MYNTARANQIDGARWVDKTGGQDVEVVGGLAYNDGVTSIVTSSGAAAEGRSLREDIDEFAFTFVTPLRAKNEGGWHIEGEIGRNELATTRKNWFGLS